MAFDNFYKPIFSMPTKGKIIDTFGNKEGGRRNDGINILAPKGNPVRAATHSTK